MEWFRKGAAAGSGTAMVMVGVLYEHGQGVPQDFTRAMEWFKRAQAHGGVVAALARKWIKHMRAAEANGQ
jgi:TPR repeat protein